MRILLDENMPNKLRPTLQGLGHQVDSVDSLHLKGLSNSRLYQEVAQGYDLLFTKDRDFVAQIRSLHASGFAKVVLTTLPQQPEPAFVAAFMAAFVSTDWSTVNSGSDWPS